MTPDPATNPASDPGDDPRSGHRRERAARGDRRAPPPRSGPSASGGPCARRGLAVDLSSEIDFARSLGIVDIGDRELVRAAGAAVFTRRRDDRPVYDRVFDHYWRRRSLQPNLEAPGYRAATGGGAPGRGRAPGRGHAR